MDAPAGQTFTGKLLNMLSQHTSNLHIYYQEKKCRCCLMDYQMSWVGPGWAGLKGVGLGPEMKCQYFLFESRRAQLKDTNDQEEMQKHQKKR